MNNILDNSPVYDCMNKINNKDEVIYINESNIGENEYTSIPLPSTIKRIKNHESVLPL